MTLPTALSINYCGDPVTESPGFRLHADTASPLANTMEHDFDQPLSCAVLPRRFSWLGGWIMALQSLAVF